MQDHARLYCGIGGLIVGATLTVTYFYWDKRSNDENRSEHLKLAKNALE